MNTPKTLLVLVAEAHNTSDANKAQAQKVVAKLFMGHSPKIDFVNCSPRTLCVDLVVDGCPIGVDFFTGSIKGSVDFRIVEGNCADGGTVCGALCVALQS